jgi:hypothetical protein
VNDLSNQTAKSRVSLVVFLPAFIHLGVCLAIWLNHPVESVWQKMLIVDFPASVISAGLLFRGVDWIISVGVVGTVWWYALSLMIRWLVRTYKKFQG